MFNIRPIILLCAVVLAPLVSSAQPVMGTFGMGHGTVAGDFGVLGGIGTSSLTFNDSSTVDAGMTIGLGCPEPTPPGCEEGLKFTESGGGGAFGIPLLRITRDGDLNVRGGLTLGGAFNFGQGFSFGTQAAPVPLMFTNNMNTDQLAMNGDGGFQTRMLSGNVSSDVFLILPADDPVPGSTLLVTSVQYDQDAAEVSTELGWVRQTDFVSDAEIPAIINGGMGYVYLSSNTLPTQGTAVVSPVEGLPDGILIAYTFVNDDGTVTAALFNASGSDLSPMHKSFYVTVMPYVQ